MDIKKIKNYFCKAINIVYIDNRYVIETPFQFSDGDNYKIYLEKLNSKFFRVTDGRNTFLHLSYENDIEKFIQENNNRIQKIKSEFGLKEKDGMFFIDCQIEEITPSIFALGQAITKICN